MIENINQVYLPFIFNLILDGLRKELQRWNNLRLEIFALTIRITKSACFDKFNVGILIIAFILIFEWLEQQTESSFNIVTGMMEGREVGSGKQERRALDTDQEVGNF